MKFKQIFSWTGGLLLLCLLGCGSPPPSETPLTVSPDYVGKLIVEENDTSALTLLLKQEGSGITGQFKIQSLGSEEAVFGNVEGIAKGSEVELTLQLPPALALRQGLPLTVTMTLTSKPLQQTEAEQALTSMGADPKTSPNGRSLWVGKAQTHRGDEKHDAQAALIDAPAPGNPFNL